MGLDGYQRREGTTVKVEGLEAKNKSNFAWKLKELVYLSQKPPTVNKYFLHFKEVIKKD